MAKRKSDNEKEESSDLVYKAYSSTIIEGKKLVKKALKLDPDNADAYVYLGNIESDINTASKYYQKGMVAGKKIIGKKDFEEMKGHFWGFHETRPFMRAKANYAQCLTALKKYDESIEQYTEMMALNPNDNQGMRFPLANLLVKQNKVAEYEKLREKNNDEGSAMWLFTYAIYLFKKQGDSQNANKALQIANEANSHIIPFLIGMAELPKSASFFSPGDENEAMLYLDSAAELWLETDNAINWVTKLYVKRN